MTEERTPSLYQTPPMGLALWPAFLGQFPSPVTLVVRSLVELKIRTEEGFTDARHADETPPRAVTTINSFAGNTDPERTVIVSDVTSLKNPRSKFARRLRRSAGRKVALFGRSGFPLLYADVVAVNLGIHREAFGSAQEFEKLLIIDELPNRVRIRRGVRDPAAIRDKLAPFIRLFELPDLTGQPDPK